MTEKKILNNDKIGCLPYVLGGLSFIPLIGVIFGIIVIIIGLTKRKIGGNKLILIGILGIIFTIIFYGTLFYKGFIEKGGTFDELKTDLAKVQLTEIVKHIEYYKLQNDYYPQNLEDIIQNDNGKSQTFISIYEPFNRSLKNNKSETYFYQLFNDKKYYYLSSRGPDQIPNTEDDIYPNINKHELNNIGYRGKVNIQKETTIDTSKSWESYFKN